MSNPAWIDGAQPLRNMNKEVRSRCPWRIRFLPVWEIPLSYASGWIEWVGVHRFLQTAHNHQIEFITSQEEFGVWLERISESRVIHFVLVDEGVIQVHANTNGIAEGFGGIEISPSPHGCCEGRQGW